MHRRHFFDEIKGIDIEISDVLKNVCMRIETIGRGSVVN